MYKIVILIISMFLIGCGGSGDDSTQKTKIITSIKEASGICYVSKTDTLFVVGDNGFVYEIDKNGSKLNEKDLSTRANNDFEGIAYDEQEDLLYIALEGVDNILVLNRALEYQREVNVNRQDSEGRDILENKNEGLEGISIYKGKVYLSNQSFKKLPKSDPSVLVKLDSVSGDKANIEEVINHGYLNISGMTFYDDMLYLVSDSGNLLIKYDIVTGKVINAQRIKDFDDTLSGIALEGVAFDNEGYIYFAIDDENEGRVLKYKFF